MDVGPSADSNQRQEEVRCRCCFHQTQATHNREKRVWLALTKLSDAVDRNNTIIESLLNRTTHAQPGATMPSSTRQGSDQNDIAPLTTTTRFRAPFRPAINTPAEINTKKKVLGMRVSFIS